MKHLIIILAIFCSVTPQDIGDTCVVQRTGSPGICRLVSDCQSVIDDIRNRKGSPTKCGYLNKVQIVCCSDNIQTVTEATTLSKNSTKIAEKCVEYGEAVYTKEYITSLSLEPSRLQKVDKCGHTAVELIVDGVAAKSREFPHMGLIGYGDASNIQYLCGGSLVSDRFILTAGHCLISSDLGTAEYVRLGELALGSSDDEAFPEDYKVTERIPHPEYKGTSQYNDIALLKLDRKVVFSPYIRPICLPQSEKITDLKAIATGWGSIGFGENKSSMLLKVTLELFGHEECAEQFPPTRKLANGLSMTNQMCAGSRNSTKDTCQGDSGGPLQIYNDFVYCTYTIIGITSFGKHCGLAGTPGVYTKVYPYLTWIENIIWS